MRRVLPLMLVGQAVVLAGFVAALRSGKFPLGVPGEWEWLRVSLAPPWYGVLFAASGVAVLATLAGFGLRSLRSSPSRRLEGAWVAGLLGLAAAVQWVVPFGAPAGYDLTRWAYVPYFPASTGYYTVAKKQVADPWRFLAEYPEWIQRQDVLHVGTHPPGLFLAEHAMLRAMEARPGTARAVLDHVPGPVWAGLRHLGQMRGVPEADRAALALSSVLTWLCCAGTVVPLYVLVRAEAPPATAWAAASLWALVPSANLFQPVADTAFPLLSTTALALAAHAGRMGPRGGAVLALGSGLVLALGTAFTLAFFPVGLIVGIVLATSPGLTVRRKAGLVLATGAGFLALTLAAWGISRADPFVIWWWNARNHARFYEEYHRTYRSWVVVNLVELAVGLGLPAAVWAGAGFARGSEVPRAAWATLLVLLLLNLSGRNLSETPRLWLPMMPPLLAAAGFGLTRFGGGPKTQALTVALLGLETLVLESTVQVVYPVVGPG